MLTKDIRKIFDQLYVGRIITFKFIIEKKIDEAD